ncbi:hypothetical protein IWW54_003140, partial [Coemansia sp. RSA 2705]
MNTAAIAVVAAICICIVITAVGILLTVHATRGWPSLRKFKCIGTSTRRDRRRHRRRRNYAEDEANDKSREDIELLSLDQVMDKLKGSRAWNHYVYARQYVEAHPMDESEGRLSNHDLEYVVENGANAWEFVPSDENAGVVV